MQVICCAIVKANLCTRTIAHGTTISTKPHRKKRSDNGSGHLNYWTTYSNVQEGPLPPMGKQWIQDADFDETSRFLGKSVAGNKSIGSEPIFDWYHRHARRERPMERMVQKQIPQELPYSFFWIFSLQYDTLH